MSRFQFSWTGDSAALTMRVPICAFRRSTIAAPSTCRRRPAGASIGIGAGEQEQHHRRRASRRPDHHLVALDDSPSTASTALSAPQRRNDVEHRDPASLSACELRRVAGRVVTGNAVLGHELDDRRIAHEQLRDVRTACR
jgi:hypothetical protein